MAAVIVPAAPVPVAMAIAMRMVKVTTATQKGSRHRGTAAKREIAAHPKT